MSKVDKIYAMVCSISYATAYGIDYVVCIGIPYGHMTMHHDHLVCLFNLWVYYFKKAYQMVGIHMQNSSHLNISFSDF